ncbi:MAG: endonuclease/exonuclease/phosphatase family protein [Pirellulaceae bacterium]
MRLFLICVAMIGLPARWCSADDAAAKNSFSVVSYNIRYASPGDGEDIWVNRKETVAKFLRSQDVFGLQEATFPQIEDLTSRLPNHDWYGLGRDDGKHGGEAAPIFFRRDRFEALSQATIWLSETPDQVGKKGWDAALPRTMTWMLLIEKKSNNKILVANTHFDHRGEQARHESGKLIRQFLSTYQKDYPVVLLGDFNCLPDSQPYQAITTADRRLPLLDARKQSTSKATGPLSTWNGFKAIVPDRIIDHVFIDGNIDILTYEVLDPKTDAGRFASDHLPIRVTIQFQPAQP